MRWQNGPGVEVLFGDECGVEGGPRPHRRWVTPSHKLLRGSCARQRGWGRVSRHRRERRHNFRLVDTAVFQCYLDELAKTIPYDPAKRRTLVLDNVSWPRSARLNFHQFECAFLPGYSPDNNPIERLWLRLKADYFADFYTDDTQNLVDHLCPALNALINAPEVFASQCASRK